MPIQRRENSRFIDGRKSKMKPNQTETKTGNLPFFLGYVGTVINPVNFT